jgi:prolipoprotein diacylglyceryltransferase
VSAFSLLVGLGIGVGLWQIARQSPAGTALHWLSAAGVALLTGLAGARLFYVLLHWHYYAVSGLEALFIWQGGLAWPGAVLGFSLAVIMIALVNHKPASWVADGLVLTLLPPVGGSIWLACWAGGCAYGAQLLPGAWWGIPAPDESGLVALRAPIQPVAALSLLLYLWLLETRLPAGIFLPGIKSGLAGLGLALNILVASLAWVEPTLRWGELRVDTWCALGLAGVSLVWLLLVWLRKPGLKRSMDET